LVSPDQFAVRFHPRQGTRPCASSDDNVLRRQFGFLAVLTGDFDLAFTEQLGGTVDNLDLVFLHKKLDAGRELIGDLARTLDDLLEIERKTFDLETEIA